MRYTKLQATVFLSKVFGLHRKCRKIQTARALEMMYFHSCDCHIQIDCDSFECIHGCHYPMFHGGDCDDKCEYYCKCEHCDWWWIKRRKDRRRHMYG